MFCRHDWEILSETTSKSKFEVATECLSNRGTSKVTIPHQMCDATRTLVQIVACNKCGKLRRFVTEV